MRCQLKGLRAVTIYSQHPSRGKIQILATYLTPQCLTSATVTSVNEPAHAAAIVDILNRISACATAPTTLYDGGSSRYTRFPADHLTAVAQPQLRPALLSGGHSLWYEIVKILLHQALADLDAALVLVPEPVRKAVLDELETEARGLHASAVRGGRTTSHNEPSKRLWDDSRPLISYDNALRELDDSMIERIYELESHANSGSLDQIADDLRLLYEVRRRTKNDDPSLDLDPSQMAIFVDTEPWGEGFCLSINGPEPGGAHPARNRWSLCIDRWIPDDDGDPDEGDSMSISYLVCDLPERPDLQDLVRVLDLIMENHDQLVAWAATPVGQPLTGTNFIVTNRREEDAA